MSLTTNSLFQYEMILKLKLFCPSYGDANPDGQKKDKDSCRYFSVLAGRDQADLRIMD
jgi:hypothetical protein